jgi:hypothetical protein
MYHSKQERDPEQGRQRAVSDALLRRVSHKGNYFDGNAGYDTREAVRRLLLAAVACVFPQVLGTGAPVVFNTKREFLESSHLACRILRMSPGGGGDKERIVQRARSADDLTLPLVLFWALPDVAMHGAAREELFLQADGLYDASLKPSASGSADARMLPVSSTQVAAKKSSSKDSRRFSSKLRIAPVQVSPNQAPEP